MSFQKIPLWKRLKTFFGVQKDSRHIQLFLQPRNLKFWLLAYFHMYINDLLGKYSVTWMEREETVLSVKCCRLGPSYTLRQSWELVLVSRVSHVTSLSWPWFSQIGKWCWELLQYMDMMVNLHTHMRAFTGHLLFAQPIRACPNFHYPQSMCTSFQSTYSPLTSWLHIHTCLCKAL